MFIDGKFHNYDIQIDKGNIVAIAPQIDATANIDAADLLVFAGFIDAHIHGAYFANCEHGEEAVRRIYKILLTYGVCSFFLL